MKKVKYGLIGCGMMGQEHIRNIALLPEAEIVCVFDPVQELAEYAASMSGGARVATSMAELLMLPEIDALVVASPNHLHLPQFREIAARRPLPLLIEKPLFTALEDAEAVRHLEASYPAPVWVAMEYRYMPPVAALIDEVQTVTGGVQMLTIREHRFPFLPKIGEWNRFNDQTGGTLVEKCCHFFDLMRLILGCDPVRVMASAGQAVNHKTEVIDGRTPDIWDHGYVLLDFQNGARAMLELCMFAEGSRYQEEITAVGPEGKIECFVPGPGRFWPPALGAAPTPRVVVSPRSPKGPIERDILVDETLLEAGDHNGSTFYQHQRFNAVVRGEGSVEVDLHDGAMAVAIGLAAQRSAETGEAVLLP